MTRTPEEEVLTANVPLLTEILQIVREGDRYDQGDWWTLKVPSASRRTTTVDEVRPYAHQPQPVTFTLRPDEIPVCTSTACVAGWGAILSAPAGTQITEKFAGERWLIFPDMSQRPISEYAREQMRLHHDIASWLFSGGRSREQVEGALEWLIDHPAQTLSARDELIMMFPDPPEEDGDFDDDDFPED